MTDAKSKGAASAAPTLAHLAEQIKTLNETGDRTALSHALEIGALLIAAKAQVAHGQWENWVRENLGMPRVRSSLYMRLAANVRSTAHFNSIAEADRATRRPKAKPASSEPKRKPRESGKRLRYLHAKRRAGDTSTLLNMRLRVQHVVSTLEAVDLPTYGVEDADRETISEVHEELSLLAAWLDRSLTVLADQMDDLQKQDTIRKLREGMNGRTDAEIATALRLADKLERKRVAS